jgi:4-carboxymuconolactone decarboxylase
MPLSAEEQTEQQRELLASLGGDGALHIFATLVRHPGLFRRWIGFAGKLLQGGRLPARDRELVILRVAWLCQARYEWSHHVAIAEASGLTPDEIRRVVAGPNVKGWSAKEANLLRAVDELDDDHCIADSTWMALLQTFDETQLIELLMLAGHYALLAGALNSIGVQPEGTLPELGEV